MIKSLTILLGLFLSVRGLCAETPEQIDFGTDLIPIFTKAGCNSGACHGAAAGRGEFHLSLYGSNPEFDFNSIVHRFEGRRVNPGAPEKSLILLKATESILHGGGTRFDLDSEEVAWLTKWIASGAKRDHLRSLDSLEVFPEEIVLDRSNPTVQLKTIATFDDRSTRDVTRWTVFTPEDDSVIELDKENWQARVLRPGRHLIIARYLDQVVPMVLLLPSRDKTRKPSVEIADHFIDQEIEKLLSVLVIPKSPSADDATFLRRTTLNLTGRLPHPDVVRKFLESSSESKRSELVETLLQSEEFTDYWTYELSKLLRIRAQPNEKQGAKTYHRWLRKQIAEAVPFDQIAKALLLAEGDSHQVGPANFFRTSGGPREQAEFVSELFLGSRLRCANCHDHPLDRWTQDDYHGLAAIFAGAKTGQFVSFPPGGEVVHPRTGEPAVKRIPGEVFINKLSSGREALANWITHRENPYFAKAIVNRLWKQMMGRGLVEPVDDFRMTNPATHPQLLEKLAQDFIDHRYDLRHTLRTIASSAAYARSDQTTDQNRTDDRYYSHALTVPLEPEVLADAIVDVTGVPIAFQGESESKRAIHLVDANAGSIELDILGRCSREESCETASTEAGGLPRTLHFLNGDLLNKRLSSKSSRLTSLFDKQTSDRLILEQFYLRALSRFPTESELQFWNSELDGIATENERLEFLQDAIWAILSSREFSTNH